MSEEKYRATRETYRKSIRGYVKSLRNHMQERCRTNKSYLARGIRCKFASLQELLDYITVDMEVADPRGLQCHRIDSLKDYEKGNLEFLTKHGHRVKHVNEIPDLRRRVKELEAVIWSMCPV